MRRGEVGIALALGVALACQAEQAVSGIEVVAQGRVTIYEESNNPARLVTELQLGQRVVALCFDDGTGQAGHEPFLNQGEVGIALEMDGTMRTRYAPRLIEDEQGRTVPAFDVDLHTLRTDLPYCDPSNSNRVNLEIDRS